jgi:hypothetical protein
VACEPTRQAKYEGDQVDLPARRVSVLRIVGITPYRLGSGLRLCNFQYLLVVPASTHWRNHATKSSSSHPCRRTLLSIYCNNPGSMGASLIAAVLLASAVHNLMSPSSQQATTAAKNAA